MRDTVSIATGWGKDSPYVSVTIHGDYEAGPTPEIQGEAAGIIFAAAEAALVVDPYGIPRWKTTKCRYKLNGYDVAYVYHSLYFVTSCDDCFKDGPTHRDRQGAVRRAMYRLVNKWMEARR